MITTHRFSSRLTFLDPKYAPDGKSPYGPYRFEQLVRERFLISKHLNTSYPDTGKITPRERAYLISFLEEDGKRQKEQLNALKAKQQISQPSPPPRGGKR